MSVNVAILPTGLWEVWDEVKTLDTPTTLLCALWLLSKSRALCPSPFKSGVLGGVPSGKGSGRYALASVPSAGIRNQRVCWGSFPEFTLWVASVSPQWQQLLPLNS